MPVEFECYFAQSCEAEQKETFSSQPRMACELVDTSSGQPGLMDTPSLLLPCEAASLSKLYESRMPVNFASVGVKFQACVPVNCECCCAQSMEA